MKHDEFKRIAGRITILLVLACLSLGGFLWVSMRTYGLGFPLDDAWIHQTYARNLAQRGEWAFIPGQPSAGSTAPLWTGALALGYLLSVDPKVWSYLLGVLLLTMTAFFCGKWLSQRSGDLKRWSIWMGVLIIFEWHLAWSGVSGMEILALTFLIVVVLMWLDSPSWNAFGVGVLIGVCVWIRPDALSLLLPVAWHVFFKRRQQVGAAIIRLAKVAAGVAFMIAPYLAFNYALAGVWLPSTFYAKQIEYAVYREIPFLSRLIDQLISPLVGAGAALIPGSILMTVRLIRRGSLKRLAPLIWVLAYLGVYALRLPVSYQHGRYAMPTIPVMLVLGVEGLSSWVMLDAASAVRRVISRSWMFALLLVMIVFWVLGSQAYAKDVAIIETEMVAAARWISTNTERGALVAAHDIGALGYYGERPLLDMAGLVSPEVIPILRDESALATFLDAQGASYLMTFPGWYPQLVQRAEPIFSTHAPFSPEVDGENMLVYRWHSNLFAP